MLLHTLHGKNLSPFSKDLFAARFPLAFFAFLRVGEFAESCHAPHVSECQLFPKHLLISFRSFKFSSGVVSHVIIPCS